MIKGKLQHIDQILLSGSIASFIFLSSLQVISRYIFNSAFRWPEELSSFLLIWMTYIGAVTLYKSDEHVRIEIAEAIFPPSIVRALRILWLLVNFVYFAVIVYSAYELLPQIWLDKAPALQISYSIILSIVPISAVMLLIETIKKLHLEFLGDTK